MGCVPVSQKMEFLKKFINNTKITDWIMVIATITIAGSTVIYTHYAGEQWRVMTGQLSQMEGSSKQADNLIIVTKDLAEHAGNQADNTAILARAAKDQVGQLQTLVETANKQNAAMTRQLAIMQKQLNVMEVDQRPWVKIADYQIQFLKMEEEKINVGAVFMIENVGKSPAVGIENSIELHVMTQTQFETMEKKQQEVCDRGQRMYPIRTNGITLLPGEKTIISFSAAMETKDVFLPIPEFQHGVRFVVYGCLDYLLQSGTAHGQTGIRFLISKNGPNNLPYGIKPNIGSVLGKDDLQMTKDLYGNYAK